MKLYKLQPNLSRTLKKQIAERRKRYEIERSWELWEKHRNTIYRFDCKAKRGRRL